MILRKSRLVDGVVFSMLIVTFSVSARASAARSFVATTGSDTNTSVNCGATTPCRTFSAALSVTSSGGEIVVLNSGGYGPVTILQPLTITAISVDASISVPSGSNGITINLPSNATGSVTINGLKLHGEGLAETGVSIQGAHAVYLYNLLIEGFASNGIDDEGSDELLVYDSALNDNALAGIFENSAALYVQNSSFDHNDVAVEIFNGFGQIVDSSAQYNQFGFDLENSTHLTLDNDRVMYNTTGLRTATGTALFFANCLVSQNTTAYHILTGSTATGTIAGTNFIDPSQLVSGTLSTGVVLQ